MNPARIEEDKRKPIEEKLSIALWLIFQQLPEILLPELVKITANNAMGLTHEPMFYKEQLDTTTNKWVMANRMQWRAAMSEAILSTIELSKQEMSEAGVSNIDVSMQDKANYVEAGTSSLNSTISDIVLGFGFLVDAIMVWNWQEHLVQEFIENLNKKIKNQLDFISTNTVLKTYTTSLEEMCLAAGIDGYTWQTMEDSRVRPTHAENNGKYFTWKKPNPVTGKPGDQVNCRCYAKIKKGQ